MSKLMSTMLPIDLMRCIFTMFAEDVELLKGEVFTKALRDRWFGLLVKREDAGITYWQYAQASTNCLDGRYVV